MRRLRAGTGFEEFGAAPIALDFYLDAFDGPASAIKPFQQRSGWLMVTDARFPMPFIVWKRTLVACITDHGEVLSPGMANVVFSVPISLPRVLEDYPPDALDEMLTDLYRSFLKRTEQDNLDHLGEAQERTQVRVSMFESECRALENQIAQAMRGLRTGRRRNDVSRETQREIDAKLERYSAMADRLGPIMRDRMRICAPQTTFWNAPSWRRLVGRVPWSIDTQFDGGPYPAAQPSRSRSHFTRKTPEARAPGKRDASPVPWAGASINVAFLSSGT